MNPAENDAAQNDAAQHDAASDSDTRDQQGGADLRRYAAIGDGRTVALIADDGGVDWLPLPDLTSAVPFAALLDTEQGGELSLRPTEPFSVTRAYVPGTNVLTSTFTTATGSVRVTDAMNTGVAGRLPWSELARRVEGLAGTVALRAVVRPGTCLNRAAPWVQETSQGVVLRVDGLTMAVRCDGEDAVSWDEGSITPEIVVDLESRPGSRAIVGLVATEREPLYLPTPADLDAGIDRTVANWQQWSETFSWDGPWRDQVQRSALALKLLINAPHGSVAAAATTSLPESTAGGKNWDYRFAWVRDMAYSLTALFRFGLREETHAAISWLLSTIRTHGPDPHIFYRLDGGRIDAGVETMDVPGWRGIGPVVVGNPASEQLQLGVYGDLFSIVTLYVDHGNVLDAATGRLLAEIADLTCDQWRRPDSGMWELPQTRHYVSSKMGCWQALDQAVHLAELGQIPGDPGRWRTERDRIRAWVDEHGWSEQRRSYVWYAGSEQLDASVLLHAISGFDRGERMRATLTALQDELGAGPHLYRYSGAAQEEGAFVACGFWFVSALALVGEVEAAEARMEQLVDAGNDVGILAEMIDPADGSFLGNLPQALSHLALINAAITVSEHSH